MDQLEKRKLDNELLAMGLPALDSPALIQRMADLVSEWPGDRHDFLRDLINECDADKRYEMYHAIVPKLKFKALTLEQYEAQIALKAGALVSQGRMRVEGSAPKPIEIGGRKFVEVPQKHARQCIVTYKCCRCVKQEPFLAKHPDKARRLARRSGWVNVTGTQKEMCADCAAAKVSEDEVVIAGAGSFTITDRRRVQ